MSIKAARERSGMTQKNVAAALEVDQSSVSLWEVGKTQPRAKLLRKMARLFGCTVDELLADDQPTPES